MEEKTKIYLNTLTIKEQSKIRYYNKTKRINFMKDNEGTYFYEEEIKNLKLKNNIISLENLGQDEIAELNLIRIKELPTKTQNLIYGGNNYRKVKKYKNGNNEMFINAINVITQPLNSITKLLDIPSQKLFDALAPIITIYYNTKL